MNTNVNSQTKHVLIKQFQYPPSFVSIVYCICRTFLFVCCFMPLSQLSGNEQFERITFSILKQDSNQTQNPYSIEKEDQYVVSTIYPLYLHHFFYFIMCQKLFLSIYLENLRLPNGFSVVWVSIESTLWFLQSYTWLEQEIAFYIL